MSLTQMKALGSRLERSRKSALARSRHFVTALGILLLAPEAQAAAALTPQVTTTTAAPRSATARARCVGCSDSTRAKHEMLISKLDSLRWEFSNRRLTQAEQEVFAKEMTSTLQALQQFMEVNGAMVRRSPAPQAVITGFGGAVAGRVSPSGESYTITVQTGRKGYIGVQLDGPMIGYPPPPEQADVIRFIQYPKIASIDPASPAERAGLLTGDTLIAMNGTDIVENSVTLSKLFVPDEKLTLRVRREGDAKEFRVVVGEYPAYVARRMSPPGEGPARVVAVPQPGRTEVNAGARTRMPPPEVAPVPTPRGWDDAAVPARLFVFGSAIGGARVETLTEGLSRAIGAKEGVLVIQAPPSSPAYVSGLRDGDVIISVSGTPVATVRQLSSAVAGADREDGVKIVILREKKQQELTLRWR